MTLDRWRLRLSEGVRARQATPSNQTLRGLGWCVGTGRWFTVVATRRTDEGFPALIRWHVERQFSPLADVKCFPGEGIHSAATA